MADFAALITQSALANQDPTKGPDVAGAMQKGASLALEREKLVQAKADLEQKKQDAKNAKMDKFVDALQKGANYEGQARSRYFNKILPTYRDSLGLTESFPNETLSFVTATPENLARMNTIIAQTRDPENPLSEAEAIALIQDPVKFADVPPEVKEDFTAKLAEAAKTKINASAQRAQLLSQEQRFYEGQAADRARQFSQDKQKLAKESEAITPIRSGLNKLEELAPGLISGNSVSGKDLKSVTGMASQIPMTLLKDEGSELRQTALGVLNAYLKQQAGASVTATELPRLASQMGMKIGPLEGGGWIATVTGTPSPGQFVTGMRGMNRVIKATEGKLKKAYGDDVYNAVMEDNGVPTTPGEEPTVKREAPKQVSTADLDDPRKAEKIAATLRAKPELTAAVAGKYGLTEAQLKKLLGIQ